MPLSLAERRLLKDRVNALRLQIGDLSRRLNEVAASLERVE